MKKLETKIEKVQRERAELITQVAIAEKGANLLKIEGTSTFVELIEEWIKYIEQVLLNLDPLDEHFQLRYSASKETKDFLVAQLQGLQNADKNLLQLQQTLKQTEIELRKQIQIVKKAEQNRF